MGDARKMKVASLPEFVRMADRSQQME